MKLMSSHEKSGGFPTKPQKTKVIKALILQNYIRLQ